MHQSLRAMFTLTAFAATLTLAAIPSAHAACGDFDSSGTVTATDALGILSTAIGGSSCALARCDTDSSGAVTATDALAVLRNAVGHGISLTCPGVAVTDIAELPRATGAVVADTTAGFTSAFHEGDDPNGILLGAIGESFGPNSSMAACQIANMTRIAMMSAAEADKILCYIQATFDGIESLGGGAIDIYDGEYHTLALEFEGDNPGGPTGPDGTVQDVDGPSLIKMKLERDGDSIVGFELFACQDRDGVATQNEYISQNISTTDFSMVAKGLRDEEWGSNSHQVVVNGDLNDAGQFVGTKLITMSHSSVWGEGSEGYGEMVVGQGAGTLDLDGFDAGSFDDPWEEEEKVYSHRVTSDAELYDHNLAGDGYQIGLLAVGTGAAKVTMRHGTRFSWTDFTEVQGWDGETGAVDFDVSADFVDLVLDADLPEVNDVEITFSESETFNCDETPEAVVTVNMQVIDGVCSHLELDHEWVDCWNTVNGGGGGGSEPGPGGPGPAPCEGEGCSCAEADICNGQAPGGCWCDPSCVESGDCCFDACDACGNCGQPGCPPEDPNCSGGCPPEDPNCHGGDKCGDGYCEEFEDGWSCPEDCGLPCDPEVDPNCFPPCDPATDPECFPECGPDDPACFPGCPPEDPDCDAFFCGDGLCDLGEDGWNCPEDCGQACPPEDPECEPQCNPDVDPQCAPNNCGDGQCDEFEDEWICPHDCGAPCDPQNDPNCNPQPGCGDGICNDWEDEWNCPNDCGGDPCDPTIDPECGNGPECMDGVCEAWEDEWNCPQDCGEPCDPQTDPECYPPCDPETDPECYPPCDPETDPECGSHQACDGPGCSCEEAASCGDQAPGGCMCDPECVEAGDCCPDACDVCGSCPQ